MKWRGVVFACLLFVSVVVIASAVSEGNEEQHEKAEGAVGKGNNGVEESKQYCRHGCCYYSGHRCLKCCGSAAEAQARTTHATVAGHNSEQQQQAGEEPVLDASQYRRGGGGRGKGGGHGGWGGGRKGGGGN